LRSDGAVVAWGENTLGQCNVPSLPAGLTTVAISTGPSHTLALRSDGSIVAWGWNNFGQVNVPALPSGLSYVEVAAGAGHSVAKRSDGSVVAWGNNDVGQCNVPVLPPGTSFVELSAGMQHNLARIEVTCIGTPSSYCTAKTNSLGCLPAIGSVGLPSASSSSGFTLHGRPFLNNKTGLLCYGIDGPLASPFGGGTLCVTAPLYRTPTQHSGGNHGAPDCSGVYAIDMNSFAAGVLGGQPIAELSQIGTSVYCQYFSRDPGFAAPNNVSLSNGLQYFVCP
jgi:hypothetical protein